VERPASTPAPTNHRHLAQFRFLTHKSWPGPHRDQLGAVRSPETIRALYPYGDPFTNECRAFGRLREADCEDLAVKCFGYVLLDEESERQAQSMPLSDECVGETGCLRDSIELEPEWNMALMADSAGRPPPFRAIIKEFGTDTHFEDLQAKDLRNLFKTICRIQQLGIINIDVFSYQIIQGKHANFSTAVTTPHILTTPELNPNLTPKQRNEIAFQAFHFSLSDFHSFDSCIRSFWSRIDGNRGKTPPCALPLGRGLRGSAERYNMRQQPSLDRWRTYTFADPRRYDWKAACSSSASTRSPQSGKSRALPRPPKRRPSRKPKGPSQEFKSPSRAPTEIIPLPRRTRHCPGTQRSMWYISSEIALTPPMKEFLHSKFIPHYTMDWEFRDGYIFPKDFRVDY
jgi:hypothetical protein